MAYKKRSGYSRKSVGAPKRQYKSMHVSARTKKRSEANQKKRFRELLVRSTDKALALEYNSAFSIGQVSTNASGHYVFDATPTTQQGNGYGARRGDEILVSGLRFKMQFWGQSSYKQNAKIKVILFGIRQSSNNTGTTTTIANAFNVGYLANPNIVQGYATNVYDFESNADPRYLGNQFVQLQEWEVEMPPVFITGGTSTCLLDVGHKFKKPWRVAYDAAGTTSASATYGQLGLAFLMDSGNCGGSANTAFPTQIPVSAANTGVTATLSEWAYFVDAVI